MNNIGAARITQHNYEVAACEIWRRRGSSKHAQECVCAHFAIDRRRCEFTKHLSKLSVGLGEDGAGPAEPAGDASWPTRQQSPRPAAAGLIAACNVTRSPWPRRSSKAKVDKASSAPAPLRLGRPARRPRPRNVVFFARAVM
ncbi:hypothetical protein EVAR_8426_1 [Eumeta japonica]|uniref:Uncharacterized protein n=1 Tax=Eumeta variegata TaxID=151549 RepID=A0A4C1WBP0_EUMVA|nr:hypothetical protein EVAR_8426_1 [Eumeta japonica]